MKTEIKPVASVERIKSYLMADRYASDEFEQLAQQIKDDFPNGFDGKLAIEALERIEEPYGRVYQARILAMYGVPEMGDYFLQKFNEVEGD
jgi:hypothetical protein